MANGPTESWEVVLRRMLTIYLSFPYQVRRVETIMSSGKTWAFGEIEEVKEG